MTKENSSLNSPCQESNCAGKNCQRRASNILQIKFLRLKGGFCEMCSKELLILGLVESSSGHDS